MARYYVNDTAQPTGEHEVHKESCPFFVLMNNKTFLGDYNDCKIALIAAKVKYLNVDGCRVCSAECHNR